MFALIFPVLDPEYFSDEPAKERQREKSMSCCHKRSGVPTKPSICVGNLPANSRCPFVRNFHVLYDFQVSERRNSLGDR